MRKRNVRMRLGKPSNISAGSKSNLLQLERCQINSIREQQEMRKEVRMLGCSDQCFVYLLFIHL